MPRMYRVPQHAAAGLIPCEAFMKDQNVARGRLLPLLETTLTPCLEREHTRGMGEGDRRPIRGACFINCAGWIRTIDPAKSSVTDEKRRSTNYPLPYDDDVTTTTLSGTKESYNTEFTLVSVQQAPFLLPHRSESGSRATLQLESIGNGFISGIHPWCVFSEEIKTRNNDDDEGMTRGSIAK
jgi:hypothetical protein